MTEPTSDSPPTKRLVWAHRSLPRHRCITPAPTKKELLKRKVVKKSRYKNRKTDIVVKDATAALPLEVSLLLVSYCGCCFVAFTIAVVSRCLCILKCGAHEKRIQKKKRGR